VNAITHNFPLRKPSNEWQAESFVDNFKHSFIKLNAGDVDQTIDTFLLAYNMTPQIFFYSTIFRTQYPDDT
jgi:hypothetical protein